MDINHKQSLKDFRLVVIAQITSVFGSSLLRFALSLYVLDLTGSEVLFATLLAVSNAPLILAPLGGAIADRFSRKNLMVIFDFASGVIIIFLYFALLAVPSSVVFISIAMVLLSVINAMYTPTVTASIPSLVSESKLESANGIVQAVQPLSMAAAPFVGAVLYGAWDIKYLIIASCAMFFISAAVELFIKIPFSEREQSGHIITTIAKDMKDGFAYVFKQPFIMKSMIIAALLNLLLTPYIIVGAPIIFRVTMGASEIFFGVGMGVINLAAILGAIMIGVFAKKLRMSTAYRLVLVIALLILPMALSVTPLLLGLGFYPSYLLFILSTMPIAAILTILSIFVITAIQKKTSNENLGKVMAIITAVAQCVAPIGQIMYGVLFQGFSQAVFIPTLFASAVMFAMAFMAQRLFKNEI